MEASVVQGTLTVSRHDDVVLIAHRMQTSTFPAGTLDGAEQVNNLTLTLEDVTGAHQVTACFEASQLVNFTTVCGTGGTLSAQAATATSWMTSWPTRARSWRREEGRSDRRAR